MLLFRWARFKMLTVLLSTKNRAEILRRTLEEFCSLQEPLSRWKLIVVDNGSTDRTAEVLASFADRLPLQVIYEPIPGKNAALNAGLRFVEGDLIVFTDDDTFPHRDWLVELRKAADSQRDYSVFGGRVLPRWESHPPRWVEWLDEGPVYALTDPSMREGPLSPYLVFGPNMAIRTAAFQFGVQFDPSVGPRSSSYAMGSETELTVRLDRQGCKAWYVPSAVVEHFIRDDQMKKAWIWKRAIRYGRGYFRLFHLGTSWKTKIWFRAMARGILIEELKIIRARLRSNERDLFSARWKRNFLWGHVVEACRVLCQRDRVMEQL
jgi:L-malate glycosyltransferase